MEFKRSAGVFAAGFVMSLVGYILGAIFAMMSASTASSYYRSDSAVLPGMLALICFLVALAGSVMTIVAMYRALVKIDALPVPAVPAAAPSVPQAQTQVPVQP